MRTHWFGLQDQNGQADATTLQPHPGGPWEKYSTRFIKGHADSAANLTSNHETMDNPDVNIRSDFQFIHSDQDANQLHQAGPLNSGSEKQLYGIHSMSALQ